MPGPDRIESALKSALDFKSFAGGLLRDALKWPVPEGLRPADVGYEWSPDEVGTDATTHKARAWELLMLPHEEQPWGVFLLEFDEPKVFDTRGFGTPLRAVLRRLVASRRKDANLRSWNLENILFICTHDYKQYVFAAFRDQFGTGKVSDAKLATFGWDSGQPCRTVVTQNLPYLEWPDDPAEKDTWLKQWARAFDKQPLTDAFFKAFDKALEAIKADLEKLSKPKMDSADAYSKAQLLLERLIFLYFVQNRGWLDQNSDFLKAGFEPYRALPKDTTYYSEFLENLFWSLSSAPGSRHTRDDNVPFLNGGLFNDDEFEPSPKRRRDNPALPIRNATFALVFDDFLEAFNFTVREDTPLNQDVAVDPEMLGKVFESIVLHAESADPDATAPDKRKETGSFYTPRIVVHFNCREVLYQWLKPRLTGPDWPSRLRQLLGLDASDGLDRAELDALKALLSPDEGTRLLELLKAIRGCDPAVGSGAFMVGLLHELTNLRRLALAAAKGYVDPARSEGAGWLHRTKAEIIQNCLFGVDIQQQAIEICMIRLWLSLVVDYDLGVDPLKASKPQFRAALKDISQLPNLEMNFKRGDSLHDHICGVPIVILPGKEHRHQRQFDAISRLGERLHNAKTWNAKRNLRLDILKKRLEVSEKVLADQLQLHRQEDSSLAGMFGDTGTKAERRKRIAHESRQLEQALAGVKAAQRERDELERRPQEHAFVQRLRKLEGASFDAPFNFAWRLDFPQVFWPEAPKTTLNGKLALGNELKGQMDITATASMLGGFDLFVGNPPFVMAANSRSCELWRERWSPYCYRKYHMLVPFFPLSFGLLRRGGELGFIVSNAFATRDFGKPLIELFFPTIDIHELVDCSGLEFPGHGTPTCLVFATRGPRTAGASSVLAIIRRGGGDPKTPPEDSPLWHALESHHADVGYDDGTVSVACVPQTELSSWPLDFEMANTRLRRLLAAGCGTVRDHLSCDIGFDAVSGADEFYFVSSGYARRACVARKFIHPLLEGDNIRNWAVIDQSYALFPYDGRSPASPEEVAPTFTSFRQALMERLYFKKTNEQRGLKWWEYAIVMWDKRSMKGHSLGYSEIATHMHAQLFDRSTVASQTVQVLKLSQQEHMAALLSLGHMHSSAVLFWAKTMTYNKGKGESAEKERHVYSGGKLQLLPVPGKLAQALRGEWNPLAKRLAELAEACWQRGQEMPSLALKKLFEKPGEAYHEWNSSLPGHEKPHVVVSEPFASAAELKQAFERAVAQREKLRSVMIALQEEMDWLVYAAYGLLPEDHPAAQVQSAPEPLGKDQRPYRLWQAADGDFARAIGLTPSDWPEPRRKLWRERLTAIRDNEHIRRIEQPVYKRRWDEQWKVKNRWECGPVAYEAELADAFTWWLLEKAEWHLEHKKDGGPIELADWAQALWRDERVQVAVKAVAPTSAGIAAFTDLLKSVVEEETVPDGIPFAKPWEELEKKKLAGLAKARKIRGKLNVPRERFHVVSRGVYNWAGLMFRC